MAGLCKRLRFRMQWELRASHADHKLRHPDCGPLDGPVPGEEFRETFKIYTTGVLGLLREQRERAAMALASLKGKENGRPISDQEYQAELASLAKDAIRAMPRRELEALLKERVDLGKPPAQSDRRRGARPPGSDR